MKDNIGLLVLSHPGQIRSKVVLVGYMIDRRKVPGTGQDTSLEERNHNDDDGTGHNGIDAAQSGASQFYRHIDGSPMIA
jgi:hypothetical protein